MSDPTFFIVAAVCSAPSPWLALSLVPSLDRCRPAAGSLLATALSLLGRRLRRPRHRLSQNSLEALRANANGASLAIWATVSMVATVGLVACAPLSMYLLDTTLASGDVASAVPLYQTSCFTRLPAASSSANSRRWARRRPGYPAASRSASSASASSATPTPPRWSSRRWRDARRKSPEPPTPLAARRRWPTGRRRRGGWRPTKERWRDRGQRRRRLRPLRRQRNAEPAGARPPALDDAAGAPRARVGWAAVGGPLRRAKPGEDAAAGAGVAGSWRAQTPPPGSVSWKPGV